MNRVLVSIVTILTISSILLVYIKSSAEPVYYSCTQAKAAGHSNIKKGDPLYRPELDTNKNDIACEI